MAYKSLTRYLVGPIFISMLFSAPVSATEITFDWTGQFTVLGQNNGDYFVWSNGVTELPQTEVSGSFKFDTANPNLSEMEITLDSFSFYADSGVPDTSIVLDSLQELSYTSLLADFTLNWSGNLGDGLGMQDYAMDMDVIWDITGLRNAIDFTPGGLQQGDIISGDTVTRGGNSIYGGIGSAIPATDGIIFDYQTGAFLNQGPAPMATTTEDYGYYMDYWGNLQYGFSDDGVAGMVVEGMPYDQYASISLDIGSGNSMTVTSVVPVPAAVWLFGSGLIGLIGFAKRKKA